MMIQERLKRSNLIMLVVPVAVAGVLLAVGLGVLVLLLETIYLPRLGLTMQDLHTLGEQAEPAFADLKHFVVLYGAVVESYCSEQSARRMAMEAASDNAGEMIENLNLSYNRARQAAITQEITEIVAGSGEVGA